MDLLFVGALQTLVRTALSPSLHKPPQTLAAEGIAGPSYFPLLRNGFNSISQTAEGAWNGTNLRKLVGRLFKV
jgi:hypothetical protein